MHTIDYPNISFNASLFIKELIKRNIHITSIGNTPVIEAAFGRHKEILYDIYSSLLSYPFGWIASDKFYIKQCLIDLSLPVIDGRYVHCVDFQHALHFAREIGYPVVVKPTVGSHGEHVYVAIETDKELEMIFHRFKTQIPGNGYILIEKYYDLREYRIFVTKNGFIAAVERIPAHVIGNGKDTILQLIQKENRRRMNPRTTCLCEIRLDAVVFTTLEKARMTIDDIPKKGKQIYLRKNSNVSTGGNCYDCTDIIHPSVLEFSRRVLNSFSNLSYIGIDLLCPDIRKPLKEGSHFICELNPAPGLSLHMLPEQGKSRNVAGALVDLLFPETKKDDFI